MSIEKELSKELKWLKCKRKKVFKILMNLFIYLFFFFKENIRKKEEKLRNRRRLEEYVRRQDEVLKLLIFVNYFLFYNRRID
jgi:hypothetical protein